jgi:hypothetical protein
MLERSNFNNRHGSVKSTVFWIDSNRSFTKDRFLSISRNPKELNHIMLRQVSNLKDQQSAIDLIHNLVKNKQEKLVQAVIIDDISSHVRFIDEKKSYGQFSKYMEDFFENQIKKLLQIQQSQQCYVILIQKK